MLAPQRIRRTITWSKDTDSALRSHLGSRADNTNALSKFVEDAVKWHLFDRTVDQVRDSFAAIPANELNNRIDEAVASVRSRKRRERKRN